MKPVRKSIIHGCTLPCTPHHKGHAVARQWSNVVRAAVSMEVSGILRSSDEGLHLAFQRGYMVLINYGYNPLVMTEYAMYGLAGIHGDLMPNVMELYYNRILESLRSHRGDTDRGQTAAIAYVLQMMETEYAAGNLLDAWAVTLDESIADVWVRRGIYRA